MSRVLQAVDSIHQVGVFCLALVPPNYLPKVWLLFLFLSPNYLFTVYIKTIDLFNLKLLTFASNLQVLKFESLKFRNLEIWNFHPCYMY